MEMPSFLKLDGQSFLFKNDGIFRFYVPEKYFTTKLAEFLGEYVSIFGILNYAIFDKNDKLVLADSPIEITESEITIFSRFVQL